MEGFLKVDAFALVRTARAQLLAILRLLAVVICLSEALSVFGRALAMELAWLRARAVLTRTDDTRAARPDRAFPLVDTLGNGLAGVFVVAGRQNPGQQPDRRPKDSHLASHEHG
jgi:hypothetical protein